MRPKALGLMALAAVASALSSWEPAHAATTCPLYLQSRVASTLTNPITEIVKNNSTSGTTKSTGSSSSDGEDDVTVGSNDGGNSDAGSTNSPSSETSDNSSTGSGSAGVPATTAPSSTATTTASPTPTTATPKTSTPTTTTTPVTTAPSSGSSTGTGGAAGSTTPAPGTRFLQASLNVAVSAGSTTGITASTDTTAAETTTGTTTTGTTTTGTTTTGTTTTGTTTTLTPVTSTVVSTTNSTSSTGSQASGNTTTSTNSTSLTSEDTFTCDETFYNQWTTLGITCGGQSIDVDAAVAASSCVIYSGSVGTLTGSTCVSICSFPACNNGAWSYGGDNGLSSSVYANYGLDSFMTSAMKTRLTARSSASSAFLSNSTMTSNKQCAYTSESSFSSCSCSAMLVNASAATDAEKLQERKSDEAKGVITDDSTSTAGNVIGPTSKSVAGVTVVMSTIAAVASSIVSGAGTASASVAAAGANVAVVTVEICQFAVFINQLNLTGKSAALSIFGKQMAPAAFTFLPFGKMKNSTDDDGSDDSTRRRLMQYSRRLTTDVTAPDSGIAKYSRTLGIEEDMLFLVTLAGVFVVMAGILALFGIAYFASGFFMSREDFMVKFFDKVIGLELLILILSQYTIGVTGTYQIYHSVELHEATDPKCILAAVSLLFLAFGIIVYGYVIVKKHEEEIRDVGTVAHMKKPVNARYGPLYDEYKFKNRFFFAPKLMVALLTGCATGYVGAEATYQVSFILAVHVIFFFYLEIKSPHHSRFVQTTTSFVTIMKIAVLVLTFFLISAAAADGFPSELQNGISLAIVGLNLFVLFLLMIRSLYSFWKKYQLQRDAKFDQEDEQTAQEYFKDETPVQKERVPLAPQNSQYQQQQSQNQQYQQQSQPQQQRYSSNVANSTHNPYVNGNANEYNIDDDDNKYTEDIRLRSGTHMQEAAPSNYDSRSYDVNRRTAANHYITDENADYERRNNVVEL